MFGFSPTLSWRSRGVSLVPRPRVYDELQLGSATVYHRFAPHTGPRTRWWLVGTPAAVLQHPLLSQPLGATTVLRRGERTRALTVRHCAPGTEHLGYHQGAKSS
jgi:hypothetical protein